MLRFTRSGRNNLLLAKQARLLGNEFDTHVKNGVLLYRSCNVYYSSLNGLPVLLSYIPR